MSRRILKLCMASLLNITIRLFKNDRIRIRILFGFSKMTEYEYEYYSAFPKWPNTNTNTSIRPQLFEYYSNTYVETHAHTHKHTHANAHIHSILHSCNWQPTELCHSWTGASEPLWGGGARGRRQRRWQRRLRGGWKWKWWWRGLDCLDLRFWINTTLTFPFLAQYGTCCSPKRESNWS